MAVVLRLFGAFVSSRSSRDQRLRRAPVLRFPAALAAALAAGDLGFFFAVSSSTSAAAAEPAAPNMALAASAARLARSVSPFISIRKRLGMQGFGLPHFMRALANVIVSVSWARVTPT